MTSRRSTVTPTTPIKEHVPAHDLEAEEAVLGSMMLSAETIPDVLDLLSGGSFYRPAHGLVFDAIANLHGRGYPVDPITVKSELERRGTLGAVQGGALFLHSLVESVPVPASAPHYARVVQEHAERRRRIDAASTAVRRLSELEDPDTVWASLLSLGTNVQNSRSRLVRGGAFALDVPVDEQPVVGRGRQVLWPSGEMTMITGPEQVGKTTLAQRFGLARGGIGPSEVLGFPVAVSDRPVLYVAADRPRQARRSLRRMVTEADRDFLDERLMVHDGPLAFDIANEPERLAVWVSELGVGTVILDSLGALAADLSKDETGSRVLRALGLVIAAGVEVAAVHHPRKSTADNRKPRTLDDSYGSRWLTAGAGSVILLWGRPGDPVVELRHLKQPAEEVGPLTVRVDHRTGTLEVAEGTDLLTVLRDAPRGLTARDAARVLYGSDDRADVEKARRRLEDRVERSLATKRPGETRKAPDVYFATPPVGLQEPLE